MYYVYADNEPLQTFRTAKEAIEYSSRNVYLSKRDAVEVLEKEKCYAYSYGFKSVTIEFKED